jgi:23S rRNA pseudouridine2605 synthase
MSESIAGERIQKVLAQAGVGSRREVEGWIAAGRVSVNGDVIGLGARIVATDVLRVDGRVIQLDQDSVRNHRVIVYSKPEGVICSRSDPEGRSTVFENLPKLKNQRWISVGRLDINTSGLLILATDGELANRLMHPSYEVDREYAVRIHGQVDDSMLARLKEGVLLEDGVARFTDIKAAGGDATNQWFHVVLMEGRNREVRRLWESQGVQVSRLKRVRYGCMFLPSRLKVGAWEELNNKEINELRALVALPPVRIKRKDPKDKIDDERRKKRAYNYSGSRSRKS